MTPEQFYSESKWFDVRDKFERRSLIFNHYDLCEFANDYAQQELQAYRDIIKELIDYCEKSPYEKSLIKYDDYKLIIKRARKLIDTVTPYLDE